MAPPSRADRTTSRVVGMNVARIRGGKGMTLRALADRTEELGAPMSSSSINDVEKGRRAVSVDQLTCLAVALDVSPIALLMPNVVTQLSQQIRLTGTDETLGQPMVSWLQGEAPLHIEDGVDAFTVEHFRRRSLPPWRWSQEKF